MKDDSVKNNLEEIIYMQTDGESSDDLKSVQIEQVSEQYLSPTKKSESQAWAAKVKPDFSSLNEQVIPEKSDQEEESTAMHIPNINK